MLPCEITSQYSCHKHTHTERLKKKKKKSSPKALNPIITRRKDLWKVNSPSRAPHGLPALTARGSEVKPRHDAKVTGETSVRVVGALDPGRTGWGGMRGRCWWLFGALLPRITTMKAVAPWGHECLVGCSLLGQWDQSGWQEVPSRSSQGGCISPSGNAKPGASYPSIQDLAIPEAKVRFLRGPPAQQRFLKKSPFFSVSLPN